MDNQVFNREFRPILLPGETARIITSNERVDVKCIGVGALPESVKDFGALTAATWNEGNENEDLEMNDFELGQYRMRINDDIKMRFNNLAPTRQWRTAKSNFYLPQFPDDGDHGFVKDLLFAMSEFFIWKDDTPRFDFYSEFGNASSIVTFTGWRMKMQRIATEGRRVIWVSDWPTGASN